MLYSNNFLLKINDQWQSFVDAANKWETMKVPLQKESFKRWVRSLLKKDKKVCVIISDALRYEIGDDFLSLINIP